MKTARPPKHIGIIGSRMKEIVIPHPAARVVWTREYVNEVKQRIRGEIK